MRRYLITSAAVLTLMTGAAMAQSSMTVITSPAAEAPVPPPVVITPPPGPMVISQTPILDQSNRTTVTTTQNPITGAVSQSKEQTGVDAAGRQIQKSESYSSGVGHVDRTVATTVTNPDGSMTTTKRQEWSDGTGVGAPPPAVTTTTTTTYGQ